MAGGTTHTDRPDHWSQIVGMPDDWDKQNLQNLISNFNKERFETAAGVVLTGAEWTKAEVDDAREKHQQALGNEHGVKIKDTEMRVGTAIPNVLWERIEKAYPTIFRDVDHLNWFIKHFPEYTVAGRW